LSCTKPLNSKTLDDQEGVGLDFFENTRKKYNGEYCKPPNIVSKKVPNNSFMLITFLRKEFFAKKIIFVSVRAQLMTQNFRANENKPRALRN